MYEQAPGNPQNQGHDHNPKDPRGNPIEETVVKLKGDEPVPLGTPPKPPFDGPQGGGNQ